MCGLGSRPSCLSCAVALAMALDLQDGQLRVEEAQAAAAQAEHGVGLVSCESICASRARFSAMAWASAPWHSMRVISTSSLRGSSRNSCSGGSSRRTVTGSPSMALNMLVEVAASAASARSSQALLAPRTGVVGEDVALDDRACARPGTCARCGHRPMPSAPKLAGELGVGGVVGVGAHAQLAHLVGPGQDGLQVAGELGAHQLHGAIDHDARGAVDGDDVALVQSPRRCRPTTTVPAGGVDDAGHSAPQTQGAPMPRAMTAAWLVLPPWAGEDALGGDHARQVVGVGLPAHQDAVTALLGGLHGVGARRRRPRPPRRPGRR